jgi:hypothetical protein
MKIWTLREKCSKKQSNQLLVLDFFEANWALMIRANQLIIHESFSHLPPSGIHDLILNLLTGGIPHPHCKLTHNLSLLHPPSLVSALSRFRVQRKLVRPHCELIDLFVGWRVELECRSLYRFGRVGVLDCRPELLWTVDGFLCAFLLVHVCLLDGLVQILKQLLL